MFESAEVASAEDATGCVRVGVDMSCRVDSLRISARWREKVGVALLARSVTQASVRAAGSVRQIRNDESAGAVADRGGRASPSSALEGLSSEETGQAMRRAAQLCRMVLDEASQQMDAAREASSTAYEGTDQRRNVRVSVDISGMVQEVRFDEGWLESVSTERLIQSIQAAIHHAYDTLDVARRQLDSGNTEAARLFRSLRAEPGAMRRWLRGEG